MKFISINNHEQLIQMLFEARAK